VQIRKFALTTLCLLIERKQEGNLQNKKKKFVVPLSGGQPPAKRGGKPSKGGTIPKQKWFAKIAETRTK
jgi:hypothetical protein